MGAHLSQHAYIPTREASCCSFVCSAKTAWYLYLNQTVVPSQTKDKGKAYAALSVLFNLQNTSCHLQTSVFSTHRLQCSLSLPVHINKTRA